MRKIRLLICGVSAAAFLALGAPVWSQSTLNVDALELYGGTYSSAYSNPAAPQTVGPASADSGWTLVPASDWRMRAPSLVGNRVEVSGNLSTQLIVNPRSSFSNIGWMKDAGNKKLVTVLFDQIGDAELAWMRKNRCSETCAGVFVRGVVVGANAGAPVLRMIDVSFESRAGGAAASMVQLDSGHADTPAVEKQLLPPGGVPSTLGPSAVTQMPAATPDTTAGKSVYERMQDHSLKMRQRDLNWEKGMIPGPERPPDFETNYRSIRDTRLSKVFANYPWNTGRNAWPRVALVVEESTAGTGGLGSLRGGDKIKDRCWRLRARLWTGPAASEDIAPFNWCLSEMRFNVSYNAVALWGRTPATRLSEHDTGPDRTLGPNPPAFPTPRFHYDVGLNTDTIMLGNILLDMSFSFGVPDGRVWVVDGAKNMAVLNKAPQQNPQTPDTIQSVNTQPAVSNTVPDVSAITASTTDEKQPDILGIKLGVSTPLEVKAAIARQSSAFTVEESPAKLTGYIRTGRIVPAPVDVPNGKYVALIAAVVSSSKPVSCRPVEVQVDCERIEVWFAAPPNAPTARIVRRVINYIHGPTVENVERSVIEKYGEPGFRQNADKVDFMGRPARYVWAWSADGKPFALPKNDIYHAPHPCAANPDQDRIIGSSFGNQSHVTELLNAGCAVVLYLNVVSKNEVVSTMRYFAVDASGIATSNTKTATFVSDYIAAVEKKEAEDAAKVKVNP